jgi:hypothetical protein
MTNSYQSKAAGAEDYSFAFQEACHEVNQVFPREEVLNSAVERCLENLTTAQVACKTPASFAKEAFLEGIKSRLQEWSEKLSATGNPNLTEAQIDEVVLAISEQRYNYVIGIPKSLINPLEYDITNEQQQLVESGDFLEFWKSRWQVSNDPVAKTALIGWGKGELVNASWFEKGSANYTWWALSSYISDHDLFVSMEEIGRALAYAHARAVRADQTRIPHLLSPHQVANYHHKVFDKYNIPSYLFGGTLPAGLYIPDIGGGILLFGVYAPTPTGWSPVMLDADTYSSWWCQGCDTQP